MKKSTTFFIVVALIGIIMTVTSFGDAYELYKNEPAKLETKTLSDYTEGEMVEGSVQYVMDVIATLETSDTIYGIPYNKKETPYYLVATEEGYVVMHITNANNITSFDSMIDQTWDYIDGITDTSPAAVFVETKTEEMPTEVQQYLYEYFEEGGLTRDDCDELVPHYVLEQKNYSSAKKMPLIGLVITIVPIVLLIVIRLAGRRRRNTYVNEIPSTQSLMNNYNTPPTPVNSNISSDAGRRYNPASYGGSSTENLGQMDEIDPNNYQQR